MPSLSVHNLRTLLDAEVEDLDCVVQVLASE